MMHGEKTLICVGGALLLCTVATARAIESSGAPYQEIMARNVFALTNPPPPGPPPDIKPPPPKITLTGIITFNGKKLALMKMVPPPKPGVKQEEQSFTLSEGQRDGDLEVLEIVLSAPGDSKGGMVKVNNFGTITNLTFENNGVKLASSAPPGPPGVGPPGVPGAPPNLAPPSGPGTYTPGRTIPGRPMRMGATGAAAYPGGYGGAAAVGSAPASTTPGTVAMGGLGAPAAAPKGQQNWPPETPMTPETAAIMGAAYNLKHQKAIASGDMPSLPPDPSIPTY